MQLQFWFDFASPYCYIAATRIEALAAQRGVEVSWHAFLLGPIFQAQGWNDSPFNFYPAKGRYMWRDVERACRNLGLAYRRPSVLPRNGVLASRVACCFADAPWLPAFVQAVFAANFERDLDIALAPTVEHCIEQAGQNPQTVLDAAAAPDAKAGLRTQTEAAARLGIFGAPFFLADGEPFWGNDRLEEALAWCVQHPA